MKVSGATMVQPSPDNNWKKRLSSSVGGITCDWEVVGSIPNQGPPATCPNYFSSILYFLFYIIEFFLSYELLRKKAAGSCAVCMFSLCVSALVLSKFGIPIINVKSMKKDIKNDSVNPEWLEKSCSNTAVCFVSSSPAGTSSHLTTSDGRMCLFPSRNWSPWQRVATCLHPLCRAPSMHMDVVCVRAVI